MLKIGVIWYNKCLSLISFKRERSHACHDLFPIGCPCVRDDWTRVNGLKYELIINFRTECDEGVVYLQLFVESVQASHGMDLPRFPQSPPVLISFLNLQGLYFLTWWGTLGVFQLFYWSFHCWNVTGPVICCQYLTHLSRSLLPGPGRRVAQNIHRSSDPVFSSSILVSEWQKTALA